MCRLNFDVVVLSTERNKSAAFGVRQAIKERGRAIVVFWIHSDVDKQLFATALREWRTDFANCRVIILFVVIGFILGLSGPFTYRR